MKARVFNLLSVTVVLSLMLTLVSGAPSTAAPSEPPNSVSNTEVTRMSRGEIDGPISENASAAAAAAPPPPAEETRKQQAREAYASLPLYFIENQGQRDERVAYYAQQGGADVYFTAQEMVMALPESVLRTRFVGANPDVRITGDHQQEAKFSYFVGDDPDQWHRDIRSYGEVTYHDLYPGVDLTYSGRNGRLKYEFVLQPGADVSAIRLAYAGVEELRLAEKGDLLITPEGASKDAVLRDAVPTVYQEIDGERVAVDATFTLYGGDTYGFTVGAYDPRYPLVIDPELRYSTFLGGSGDDGGGAIALDGAGNVYVMGRTESGDFPTTAGAYDETYNGGDWDVFVSVLDPTLGTLSYPTFLGGNDWDYAETITLGDAGNVYVTGHTESSDFPTTAGAYDETYNGGDVFVSVLDPTLSSLSYSTFLGGSSRESGGVLALDGAGNIYVTGNTASGDFPTTAGAYDQTYNGRGAIYGDVFVSVLDPTLSALSYSTFLGGSNDEWGYSIALDDASNAYVTGQTESSDFPTTAGAYDQTYNGGDYYGDVFVSVLDPTLSSFSYSTFLGGNSSECGDAIALDGAGNVYMTGWTWSNDFPTTAGAYDETYNGGDAFVSVLDPTLGTLSYSTFLGGSSDWDNGYAIALDGARNVYVTGDTYSSDFPTTAGAYDAIHNGDRDIFVSVLDTGGGVTYSISGQVCGSSGNPVPDVTVSAGASGSATTDASGAYTITNLITGTYTLTPTKDGWTFTPPARTVTVPPSATGQDFTASAPNRPPNQPTGLSQFESDGTTPIPVGGTTDESTVVFKGGVSDPDGDQVKLQIELRRLDEYGGSFIDEPTKESGFVSSDTQASVVFYGLVEGDYHWQARAVDDSGTPGPWVSFGDNLGSAVDFTVTAPPPSEELMQAIDSLDARSRQELDRLGTLASDAGDDGDYFFGAVAGDTAELALDLAFGFADFAEVHYEMTRPGVQLALPGLEPSWSRILKLKTGYQDAGNLFDLRWQHAIQKGHWRSLTRPILRGGLKYYAARFRNGLIEWYDTKEANRAWHDIASSASGLSGVGDLLGSDVDDLQRALTDQRAELLEQGIGRMSLADQREYARDLEARRNLPLVLASAMKHRALLLDSVRAAHETTGGGFTAFVLKFLAENLAGASFDGPGKLVVSGLTTSFDAYLDYHKLTAAGRAYQQAMGVLKGSAETTARVFANYAKGMDRVTRRLPARPASGAIGDVTHYSGGAGWGPFWREHESYTDVEVTNTGDEAATFEVIVQYAYYDRVLGLPWSWQTLVTEEALQLAPGHSAPIRVYYKQEERGGSPEEGSIVYIDVLATNETGTFYVDTHVSTWEPQRTAASAIATRGAEAVAQALEVDDDALTIENPIDSYVLSDPWNQGYEAQLWVANPLTDSITAHVTQTLPSGVTLLESADATVNGSVLTWQRAISAETTVPVTYTFPYPATPGTVLSLPAAEMGFLEPISGQHLTTHSNTPSFEALWPVLVEGYAPWAAAGAGSTMPVTITNLLTETVSGSVTVMISNTSDVEVYSQTQPFTLPAAISDTIDFTLPATLPNDDYLLEGWLDVDGASRRVIADIYRVGALGPAVRATVSPTGFVHLGQVLTYTVHVTNTTGLELTGSILSTTVPVSTTLLPGSISHDGVERDGAIQWNLGVLNAEQGIQRTFSVQVDEEALRPGESLPIESLPSFISNQTRLVFGMPAQSTVLAEPCKLYIPLVLRKEDGNLLINPGFEDEFGAWNPDDCPSCYWGKESCGDNICMTAHVCAWWIPFWENCAPDDSDCSLRMPEYKSAAPFASRIRTGGNAQQWFTSFAPHVGGVFQTVGNLQPGARVALSAYAQGWSSNDGDVESDHPLDNMVFRVGIDPDGGTDPWASSIVWSPLKPSPDAYRLIGPVEAQVGAEGKVTVFLYSTVQHYPFRDNNAYFDDVSLVYEAPPATPDPHSTGSSVGVPSF